MYITTNDSISAASMSGFSAQDITAKVHTGIMMVWKTPHMAAVQESFCRTLGEHGIRTDNLKRQSTYPSTVQCTQAPALCVMHGSHTYWLLSYALNCGSSAGAL